MIQIVLSECKHRGSSFYKLPTSNIIGDAANIHYSILRSFFFIDVDVMNGEFNFQQIFYHYYYFSN